MPIQAIFQKTHALPRFCTHHPSPAWVWMWPPLPKRSAPLALIVLSLLTVSSMPPMGRLISAPMMSMAMSFRLIKCFHGMAMALHGFPSVWLRCRMTVLLVGQPKIGNLARAIPVPMPPCLMLLTILNGLAVKFVTAMINAPVLKPLAMPSMITNRC